MPTKPTEFELERGQFRLLTLANPNYFGTIEGSKFPVVKAIARNTTYEELKCVGYQPQLGQLEAVVHLKLNSGFSGPLCGGGSQEFVRFYLSFDGGATWQDQGVSQLAAHDSPGPRPLEYAVTRPVNPPRKFCFFENLIKVRAILSWNVSPTPNTPGYIPVWGNVLEADIQVQPFFKYHLRDFVEVAKFKIPPELDQVLDLNQELSVLEPKAMSLAQKVEVYAKAKVPEHRFIFDTVQPFLSQQVPDENLLAQLDLPGELLKYKIDLKKVIDVLLKTDGDTSFEELTCVGYDPGNDALIGIINVKKSSGYSGKLCSTGSREYVAFWMDWGAGWEYVGTSSVQVHDITNMPASGLKYAVFEGINVSQRRRPCQDGPVTAKVRAILSWQSPPPPANPNWVPTWGNREETLIQIAAGAIADYEPILESVGGQPICNINPLTGRTLGAYDQPFGGQITITGFIPNAPDISTPDAFKLRYRIQVKPVGSIVWQTVSNDFSISVIERIGLALPTQYSMLQSIEPDGYYTYREDMNVSGAGWRLVQNRVLANWITAEPMTGRYDIKVDAKDPATNIQYSAMMVVCTDGSSRTTVRVDLDEIRPDCAIDITGFQRGGGPVQPAAPCGTFVVGDILHGTYSVFDEHFGSLSLTVEPVGPANGATPSPSSRFYPVVLTAGEAGTWTLDTTPMQACGYIIKLWAQDRTIASGDTTGWKCTDSDGFCLKKP